MKTCQAEGCNSPQFGGGFCKYHQFRRKMRGGDSHQYKPRQKKIATESPKRKEEKKYYTQHCKELEQEIREQNDGRIFCFFSGLEITGRISWHHLKKRTGDFYIDKQWLVPSINWYHTEGYHFAKYEWLMEQPWYEGFLQRLKEKDEGLWMAELKKKEKSEFYLDISE